MIRAGNERTGNALITIPVKEGAVLKENTIAVVNASGYAETGSKATGLLAAGRVEELADNSAGSDGDITVKVKRGTFVWDNDGNTIQKTDILKPCYIAGETSVTATESEASPAGIILAVDPDGVTVDMTQYVPPTGE